MPRPDRIRRRREIRFKQLAIRIKKRGRVRIGVIVKQDQEAVRMRKELTERLRDVEDEIARSIIYVRSIERRKALMEIYALAKSIREDLERTEAKKELGLLEYGIEVIRDVFRRIINYARAGFGGIPREEDSLTHEIAQRYYTPLNATDHHFTGNFIRLTDMTMQFLEGMRADFNVAYQTEVGNLTSPWTRVANVMLQLAEFLSELMRRKSKRERVRNKSKGHYGVIDYDEPIHTVIDFNRIPIDEQPLNSLLGNTYNLARDKARSVGRPELANRIITVGVYVIPERKSKLAKREILTKDPTLSYEYRFRSPKYF